MVKDKARVRARIASLFPKAAHMAQKRIDAIADRLEATDDSTDEEIDAELTNINDTGLASFEEIVRTDDQLAAAKKKDTKPPKNVENGEGEEDDTDPNDPTAGLLKRLSALEQELAAEKERKQKDSITTRFMDDPRLKDVPQFFKKRAVPATEEEYEDAVTSLSEEYKTFAIENKLSGFTDDTPPAGDSRRKPKTVEEAPDEEVDNLADSLLR